MISELQSRFEMFESKRMFFLDRMNKMTAEQLSFKPHADHWNMLDIVQHLMLSERAFLLQVTEKTFKPRKPRFHPLIGSFILWLIFKVGIHVKVPVKSALPKDSMSLHDSTALWQEKRTGLKEFFETLDRTSARQKLFFHPIRGGISSITLVEFLTVHFDHHMKQVKRIQRSPHYPK